MSETMMSHVLPNYLLCLATDYVQLLSASIRPQPTVSCSWSGSNSAQSADDGWSCHDCLPHWLLPAVPITQSLTPTVAQTIVQAFISCRLDYCNSPTAL